MVNTDLILTPHFANIRDINQVLVWVGFQLNVQYGLSSGNTFTQAGCCCGLDRLKNLSGRAVFDKNLLKTIQQQISNFFYLTLHNLVTKLNHLLATIEHLFPQCTWKCFYKALET